jgi:hypothetical protein
MVLMVLNEGVKLNKLMVWIATGKVAEEKIVLGPLSIYLVTLCRFNYLGFTQITSCMEVQIGREDLVFHSSFFPLVPFFLEIIMELFFRFDTS